MRRVICILAAVVLGMVLTAPVSAAISASSVGSHATVARDGSCQVTLTATVHLDQVREDLEFPLPGDATSVTVNGSRVRTTQSGSLRVIDLDKILGKVVGDFSLSIHYTLPDVIHATETGALELRVPMLSGFAYPIQAMEFSVTLPGAVEALPAFESGYHQANIERDLTYKVDGAAISGSFQTELKDHETLAMTLMVDEEMFPQSLADTQDFTFGIVAMGICAGVAFAYWLLALRFWPLRRIHSTQPPQGYTAGEMGCVLNMQGVDLHLTVLSWAQLGYVLIHIDRHGKVMLHKRMDMGNERKEAEQRLFKKLFGKRNVVDTTSYQYATLTRLAGGKPIGVRELMHPRTGNPKVFRVLASGIGLFGGICIAIAMSGGAVLQGLLILLLGALGAVSGWYVQNWGCCLVTPKKYRLSLCLAVCGIWLLLGLAAGIFMVALWMVLGMLAAGLLFAWGGRRTDIGRQTAAQVMGLRRYMRTADKLLLQRLQDSNPDYFFTLAPYALVLGVDKAFAKRFGNVRLSDCPYLTTGMDAHMTAAEWMERIRATLGHMDDRARKLPLEKLLGLIRSFTR